MDFNEIDQYGNRRRSLPGKAGDAWKMEISGVEHSLAKLLSPITHRGRRLLAKSVTKRPISLIYTRTIEDSSCDAEQLP